MCVQAFGAEFAVERLDEGVVGRFARARQARRMLTRQVERVPDTSLPGLRVVRELDSLIASRGRPAMCVSDNGTELTGMAILRWSQQTRVEWHYIAPGKPQQNAFISVTP